MKLLKRFFIPDTHTPFHDEKAFKLVLKVLKDFKPDEVVYLGDFFDCYSISSYDKDPELTFNLLDEELAAGKELMREVERVSKARRFVFLEGNHEARIRKYFNVYAPKLANKYRTRELLEIPSHYTWHSYGQANLHKCGKLIATHGDTASRHAAATMVQKYGKSVIFGHTHRVQQFLIRNIDGEVHCGINCGHLSDTKRAGSYLTSLRDWAHGFAFGYFRPDGHFYAQVVTLVDYSCVVEGKYYSV